MVAVVVIVGGVSIYMTQPMWPVDRTSTPKQDASPTTLERDLRHLVTAFHPRSYDQPKNLDAAAAWIKSRFESEGLSASYQDYEAKGATYRNVVTSIGPKDGERIVIGAHYDTCDDTPGADDNASGTVALFELARLFKRSPPERRVDLVAFTLEEPPFFRTKDMGSRVYAESLKKDGVDVRLMMSLEMIGYFSDQPGSQDYPHSGMRYLYSDRGDFVLIAGEIGDGNLVRRLKREMTLCTDLPVYSINGPRFIGIDKSDQLSFWEVGYTAVMITDTAYNRNKNYHQPTDTPDTLDYRRMARVVDGVFGMVTALSRDG
jgi:Zn-dependent M28 family amino/carboxypeptidase